MAVGNRFGGRVPLAILAGAEIRLREDFLEAQHLHAAGACLLDEGNVRLDHPVPDLLGPIDTSPFSPIWINPHLSLRIGPPKKSRRSYLWVGKTYSAPAPIDVGQREVTVFSRV